MKKFRERKLSKYRGGEKPRKSSGILRGIITILLMLSLLFLGYLIYILFNNIFNSDIKCSICSSSRDIILKRGDVTTSLIVIGSPMNNKLTGAWLIVEKENTPSITVIYIPPGVSVGDYTGSFNSFIQVSDLEYAGKLLNDKRAKEYAIWQIENMSGFTVQKYMWLDSNSLDSYSKLFGDMGERAHIEYSQGYNNSSGVSQSAVLVNSIFDSFNITNLIFKSSEWNTLMDSMDTNISGPELPLYFMHMKNVLNAGSHTMIDLSQRDALNQIQNDSGRIIETINYTALDKKIEEVFSNIRPREIEKEQARIEVYNGSEVSGLASRYARRIQNFGVNVVRYDNAPDSVDRTTIYISNKERFESSFEAVKLVSCKKCKILEGRPEFITTGDIVVILGKEKAEEISWR